MRSDIEHSLRISLHSIRVAQASGNQDLAAASMAMAANGFLLKGERKKSEGHFKKAWAIYQKTGDIDAALEMECGLASARLTTGNEKEILVDLHKILHTRTNT